jgi:Ras-related protein Rab-7A
MNGGMLFFEVSAKTGDNVQTGFEAIVKKALEKARNDGIPITGLVFNEERKVETADAACAC